MVKYIKLLLPALFMVYFGSVSLFTHVHVVNGTTIVHSHPFDKRGGADGHKHGSLAEIQLFNQLSSIYAVDGAIHPLELHFFNGQFQELFIFPVYSDVIASFEGAIYLRAPPFMA